MCLLDHDKYICACNNGVADSSFVPPIHQPPHVSTRSACSDKALSSILGWFILPVNGFLFFEFYLQKKVTKPYKSIFTSISTVFRVNQVFFSSRGPPFLHKLQTLRPAHSRTQNAEHTSCEVSIDHFSVKRSSKRTNATSK